MQELWFLCMIRILNMFYKCMNFLGIISNGYQVIERTRNSIANIPEISKAELWFLCMPRCLNVLYKRMKIRWNTSVGYQITERTRNNIANGQSEITIKYPKQNYMVLNMTGHLNVLSSCMTNRWNISNCFLVIERTWLCYWQTNWRKVKQYVSRPF